MSTKADTLIALRIPADLSQNLNHAVVATDSDKSKFIRSAIRRELERLGIPHDLNRAARAETEAQPARQPVTA